MEDQAAEAHSVYMMTDQEKKEKKEELICGVCREHELAV